MKNVILVGMPAAGKSTVGVVIAKRLGFDFIDTDLLIQQQEGCLLKDIIRERGIEGFLAVENQVNQNIQVQRAVISPGGSVVYCKEAMEHFKNIGNVVYLRLSFETIECRIKNAVTRGVVLREGQTLQDIYRERTSLFEQYADIIIDVEGLDLDAAIEKVLQTLENRGMQPPVFRLE